MPTLQTAKNVISTEVEGLNALAASLGAEFEALVEKIYTTTKSGKGRVIVSGMGKSGHIAGKIAATMASTGTPAFFVHPAEASHGDMGMITQNDIVILLSNSGETAELKDIITYCKRFGIFLVGIIRKSQSTLTSAADIALVLPNTPEANNVNAPTTSTTQMLLRFAFWKKTALRLMILKYCTLAANLEHNLLLWQTLCTKAQSYRLQTAQTACQMF
jgi:arabinose-5-phosphate isomerase